MKITVDTKLERILKQEIDYLFSLYDIKNTRDIQRLKKILAFNLGHLSEEYLVEDDE